MYSEITPMSRKNGSIKGFEIMFLSDTKENGFSSLQKSIKPHAQAFFDDILKNCSIPMNTLDLPGRFSKNNNNTDMISYAAMLIKDTTPYDYNITILLKSSLKYNIIVPYDINATNEFPNISITTKKIHERTRDATGIGINTPTTATIPNEDNISTLLDENNKTEQANVTKIISENNEYNKLTFLQMLEDNNNKNKTRHYGNFTDNHVRK